jgi:hypothetical protein
MHPPPLTLPRGSLAALDADEAGSATAEYAIAMIAAAGFAGLLVTLLTSETVRSWLSGLIERALSS